MADVMIADGRVMIEVVEVREDGTRVVVLPSVLMSGKSDPSHRNCTGTDPKERALPSVPTTDWGFS